MQKILVVYSWDDETSQRRYQHHMRDPNIQAYNFEQCFALASPGQRPEAEDIFSRVSMAIGSFWPDVVLMHTGAAYHRAPQEFVSCFIRLKEAYPAMRFGYERQGEETEVLDSLQMFDRSQEMQAIEAAFFG